MASIEQVQDQEGAAGGGKPKRSFKHLLLDWRFQLKYTAMILGVATVISVALGTVLLQKIRESSRMLELEAAVDEVFQAQLAAQDASLVALLVGGFVAFLVVLGIASVLITHRMAGPIFVMRRYIATLGAGKIPKVRNLRRGDEFLELYETMRSAIDAIEAREQDEIAALQRAIEAISPGESPSAGIARSELTALVAKKLAMLQDRASVGP